MKIKEALQKIKVIRIEKNAPPVVHTVAEELGRFADAAVETGGAEKGKGVFWINVDSENKGNRLQLDSNGAGRMTVEAACFLYGFYAHLMDRLSDEPIESVQTGLSSPAAFAWQRATYDYFLNQEGRIQRGMNKATYIRSLAAWGFTHIEINGLAYPMGLESGPKGETYPMFYTYCPALDQFVYSELNKGLYPFYYLAANLENLKENARIARRYGMIPGLLCFEPRSVPEAFFQRYPMLRGARVDHPFRSFKPRYNMTITHPRVRAHYQEMLTKLIQEVPELGFLALWTNDSGAGFEHTQSLYVGRNGGPYLIREWKDQHEIARVAGENAIRFMKALSEAGRKTRPDFRVITRMESFYGEHETIWNGLGDGLDVETASLIARGWEMPYTHPRYPDSSAVNAGTIYQDRFDEAEKVQMKNLEDRGGCSHFYFGSGPNIVFAPLLGIPYPRLVFRRLETLHKGGVRHLSLLGGTFPPELVPFNVNHEILQAFQFDPCIDCESIVKRIARKWAGDRFDEALCRAWEYTEEAVLAFPNVTTLYSTFGFVWYRLWARPLVPDMEAVPHAKRSFYEDFMCTTPHNPNNVDLSRDVLFQLCDADSCKKSLERIDKNLWEPMDQAIKTLQAVRDEAGSCLGQDNVIEDQLIRLQALRCWFMTQRNVAAWIVSVHGYLKTKEAQHSDRLKEAIDKEIENSITLISLIDSGVPFMAVTDKGETPLIHGENLKELLQTRIALMKAHRNDTPYIDPLYIEKKAGNAIDDLC